MAMTIGAPPSTVLASPTPARVLSSAVIEECRDNDATWVEIQRRIDRQVAAIAMDARNFARFATAVHERAVPK